LSEIIGFNGLMVNRLIDNYAIIDKYGSEIKDKELSSLYENYKNEFQENITDYKNSDPSKLLYAAEGMNTINTINIAKNLGINDKADALLSKIKQEGINDNNINEIRRMREEIIKSLKDENLMNVSKDLYNLAGLHSMYKAALNKLNSPNVKINNLRDLGGISEIHNFNVAVKSYKLKGEILPKRIKFKSGPT